MLDPVKNARALGILLLIIGVIQLPFVLLVVKVNGLTFLSLISIVFSAASLVVPYGLFKTKAWAVYGFGLITLLILVSVLASYVTEKTLDVKSLLGFVISVAIFLWFYSGIKRFKK